MSEIEWNGEGLPPVGAVCEFNSNWAHKAGGESWHKVKVVFMSDETYVVRRDDAPPGEVSELCGSAWMVAAERFRPIRTPEQIAAEAREEAVRQICIDAGSPEMTPGQMGTAYRLYDAGYRKQVTP